MYPLAGHMRGHGLHIGFRVLQTCLCVVLRYVKYYQIPSWCKNSISSSISKQMERMSWLRTATWTWRRSVTNAVTSLNPRSTYFSLDTDPVLHRLREGFRTHSWTCWQSSNRRDSVLCQHFPYDETRCANARKASQITSQVSAIITGGYVSNASFHRSDGDGQRLCPQCHVISSLHHEFWERPHIPNAATRPAIPECILQQRLGWPSHDKNSEAILAWQVSVRKDQLNLRYKPPVQNAPMWFPFSDALVEHNLMWVFPCRICWCNESPMYLWHPLDVTPLRWCHAWSSSPTRLYTVVPGHQ